MRAASLFATMMGGVRNRTISEMSAFLWSGTVSGNELVNDKGTGNITITNKDFTTTIPYTSLATFSMAPGLEAYDTDGFWFSSGTPLQKSVMDLVETTSQKTLVKQSNTTFEISKIGLIQGATPSPTEKTTLTSYFDLWCYHFGALNMSGFFKYNRGLQSGSYGYEMSRWSDQNNIYGVTMPGSSILTGWNSFIHELKEAGLWSRITLGYLLNSGGVQAGRLNIKNPATYRSTIVNSPTFTEGQGTKSDGSGYINPGLAANAMTPTNFTCIVYVKESSTSSLSQEVFGARTNTDFTVLKFRPKTSANGDFNNGTATNSFTNANHQGLYVLTYQTNRPVIIKDGTKTLGSVETPSSPNVGAHLLLLARNISTTSTPNGSGFYTQNVGAAFFADAFTDADELSFRTIFNNNKTAMGL